MLKFFRKIRQKLLQDLSNGQVGNKVTRYLAYALGEIFLVVIGILIALQVNNWNEKRKMDERFMFGLRELHGEIRATAFYESAFQDKLKFQLIRIDSVLNFPDYIPVHRLPGMIQLFDEFAIETRDNVWKSEYLEIVPGNEDRNNMAKSLRNIVFGLDDLNHQLKDNNLFRIMSGHLRKYDIPIQLFYAGTGYEEFIQRHAKIRYTDQQLENVKFLIRDPSFIADLMTLKTIKENVMNYTGTVGFSAESFLHYVQQYDPNTDYQIKRMEIIGPGLPYGQWSSGNLMKRVHPGNESIWEIEQLLVDGVIKFRADGEWILDWGKGESDPKMLVFKGGDIPVKKGNYKITIDIKENKMDFIPINK